MHRTSLPIKPIDTSKFYVIAVISNPVRYRVRYDLYRRFAKHVTDSGARLITVEAAFGNRPFEVTEANNPRHIQLRTNSEVWHKENMINIGISRLPSDWEQVAWVDADIAFVRPDWVQETVQQLQHYSVVQLWSMAHDMLPNGVSFRTYNSFCYCYNQSINMPYDAEVDNGPGVGGEVNNNGISAMRVPTGAAGEYMAGGSRPYWHSGYAWAARREAIDNLGGLIDWAVLGSGDHHMALALIGEVDRSVPAQIGQRYKDCLKRWEANAEAYIKRNIGYVEGTIFHFWHGAKSKRRYNDRWKIITKHNYDPDLDLKQDWQGLHQLTDNNFRLRDDLRFYLRGREEDSIDPE